MSNDRDLLTLTEASEWASSFTKKKILPSNISYLINYAKIRGYSENGTTKVSKAELEKYYALQNKMELEWKDKLGDDLNWDLSFDRLREKDRTKHVHRLHPYKGKFIPQLVEYFLDDHTDSYKEEANFTKGDVVLDPFCGSGTTLVQANEVGLHAIGIEISEFNSLISNVKINRFDLFKLSKEIDWITHGLEKYLKNKNHDTFEDELSSELKIFNPAYFPSPEYKFKIRNNEINEDDYSKHYENVFRETFNKLVAKYQIHIDGKTSDSFLDVWYLKSVRDEIFFVLDSIDRIEDQNTRNIIRVILSRAVRSCRATTHSDLATLKHPVRETYYCTKHYKICKPLFSMLGKWKRYSRDTIERLIEFNNLRTETLQVCITGDAAKIDIVRMLRTKSPELAMLVESRGIRGIFTSPPYVGLIDYHEQHAYAYELYGFDRRDSEEIGPMFNGRSKAAREEYVQGIANVLINCKKYLTKDFAVFLVANDKFNLYPEIASKSGMVIEKRFKRPVLSRTERNKAAFSETIFHLKEA